MPTIEIQRIAGTVKDRIDVSEGYSLIKFIEENNLHNSSILINGSFIEEDQNVDIEIKENDIIKFFDQPLGGGLGAITGIFGKIFGIVGKVFSFLLPKPSIPNQAGQTKESPNNKLTGQTNIARTYQARPDIYGSPICYPDLINQSLFEYRENEQFLTEWMNFGIGTYTVSRIRYSESTLTALSGSSYRIYNPNELIPIINEGFAFDDVDGQKIPGSNEREGFPIYEAESNEIVSYEFLGSKTNSVLRIRIIRDNASDPFDYFNDLDLPHDLTFIIKLQSFSPTGSIVYNYLTLSGQLTESSQSDNGDIENTVYYHDFTLSFNTPFGFGASNFIIATNYFVMRDNKDIIVGAFFAPIAGDQFWVHFQADLGESDFASCEVIYYKIDEKNEEIDGTLSKLTVSFPPNGKAQTFFRTEKITPSFGFGRYAFKFRKLQNSSINNNIRLDEIHSVRVRTNVRYKNDTVITIETKATKQATGGRERKFNAMLTRHTISYNMITKSIDYNLRPSRSFADAVLHEWIVVGGQSENSIDAYELYRIYNNLPDPRLGYFDFTFDDEDVSLGSRIETICNVADVTAYFDGGVLSFVRDEKKLYPSMLFNSSNTRTDGYKLSYDMTLPGGFDGVDLQYVNPNNNKYEQIVLAIVGDNIVKQQPIKPSKIELAGCRDKYQAMDRAILECRRLIYSRVTQQITAIRDGGAISIGSMVQYSDTFDTNHQEGYIKSRTGNEFKTSESINFSGDMYVTVTDFLGQPTQKTRAFPIDGDKFGFIANVANIKLNIWDGEETQSPSRYIIATQTEIDSTRWTVTQKQPSNDPNNGGETDALTLVEYSDEMYEYQDLINNLMIVDTDSRY